MSEKLKKYYGPEMHEVQLNLYSTFIFSILFYVLILPSLPAHDCPNYRSQKTRTRRLCTYLSYQAITGMVNILTSHSYSPKGYRQETGDFPLCNSTFLTDNLGDKELYSTELCHIRHQHRQDVKATLPNWTQI